MVGDLTEQGFRQVKQILSAYTNAPLKDTLIIKYDYNKDDCWRRLDSEEDEYILKVISNSRQQRLNASLKRPGLSIFSFRQEGTKMSKLIRRDSTRFTDKGNKLFNLLFQESSKCGNSIILLQNKKFLMIRSDAHFDALRLDKNRIEYLLAQ